MNFFDSNGTSDRGGNEINKLKKQLKALQEQTDALSVAISDLEDTVSENKGESEQRDLALGENISINTNGINSLEENLENYKTSQAEITEAQVIRATSYIETPLLRQVETETVEGEIIYGSENKRKRIFINKEFNGNYILIGNDDDYTRNGLPNNIIMSLNGGKIILKTGTILNSVSGNTTTKVVTINAMLANDGMYETLYNLLYTKEVGYGSSEPILYYVARNKKLILDWVDTPILQHTKEYYLNLCHEVEEKDSTELQSWKEIKSGITNYYGAFYDKDGDLRDVKLDYESRSSSSQIISGSMPLANVSLSAKLCKNNGLALVSAQIATLSYGVNAGTEFDISCTELFNKTNNDIPQLPFILKLSTLYQVQDTDDIVNILVTSYKKSPTRLKATVLNNMDSTTTYYSIPTQIIY